MTDQSDPVQQRGVCGRCYAGIDEVGVEVLDTNCRERPEMMGALGMYHCPDCGAMVLGGYPHPLMCRVCLERRHPHFDLIPE
jgi:hypothetical protein